MSMFKNGGPAFPIEYMHWEHLDAPPEFKGMSLRDWFAGRALTGLLATYTTDEVAWEKVAARAYGLADAMLAAREADPS